MKLTLLDKALLLKKSPLFTPLDFDMLLIVADKLHQIDLKKREPLFIKGDLPLYSYLLIDGEIDIQDNVSLAKIVPIDFFGEESIFSDTKRAYEAQATKKTTLLALSKTHLFSLLTEYPAIAVGLLADFSSSWTFRPRKNR